MKKVEKTFNDTKDRYFQHREVWIVKATIPDATNAVKVALDLARSATVTKLAEMGLRNPGSAGYSFHLGSHGNSPEFPDKGTVIAGQIDKKIEVWVENRLLRRWDKQADSNASFEKDDQPPVAPQLQQTSLSNPNFPRTTGSGTPQISYSNPVFPRPSGSDAPNAIPYRGPKPESSNKLRYVKSRPDKEGAGRLIETSKGEVLIGAGDWEKANISGKPAWLCKRHKIYTDR